MGITGPSWAVKSMNVSLCQASCALKSKEPIPKAPAAFHGSEESFYPGPEAFLMSVTGHRPMRSLSPRLHHTAMPSVDVPSEFSVHVVRVGSSSVRSLLCVVGECYVGPLCFPDSSVSSKSPLNPLSQRGVSWDPLRQKQQ